jgi:TP901-1 family phage major tail protein
MYKLGLEGKLYYGDAGAMASNELKNAKDVTLNLEASEADVTTRANNGWRATVAALKDASIEWEMVWNSDDAGFAAIKNAYLNGTAIALAILDGADGEGLDADFAITSFSRSENLEDAMTVSVTAKPTYSTRAPAWKEATP